MTSFTFLSCGDAHIGAGYAHGNEGQEGNSRLADFGMAWKRLCVTAVERGAGAVFFGGDAFRDAKPTPAEEAAFAAGLDILRHARIPLIAAEGNHDKSKNVNQPSALAIFERYQGGDVRILDRPAVLPPTPACPVAIALFPYVSRAHVAANDQGFAKLTIDEQNERLVELSLSVLRGLSAEADQYHAPCGSVLVAHGTISGSQIGAQSAMAFMRDAVIPLSELEGLNFRFQGWSHLHRRQVLVPGIAFAGSIERVDFAEAEEDKGAWLVTVRDNPDLDEMEWVSSSPRSMVDVEIAHPEDWQYTLAFTPEMEGAIVRVRYSATPEQRKTIDDAAIKRALLAAGAVKVHGPIVETIHTVTERTSVVTEEADMQTALQQYLVLQGVEGPRAARLTEKVRKAMEVVNA